jgi:hypothetical protein
MTWRCSNQLFALSMIYSEPGLHLVPAAETETLSRWNR